MRDTNCMPEQFRVNVEEIVRDMPDHEEAMLVRVSTGNNASREVWLPYSQVHSIHKTDGYLMVTPWIAKKKGLL